jgi:hypothetical protein
MFTVPRRPVELGPKDDDELGRQPECQRFYDEDSSTSDDLLPWLA